MEGSVKKQKAQISINKTTANPEINPPAGKFLLANPS